MNTTTKPNHIELKFVAPHEISFSSSPLYRADRVTLNGVVDPRLSSVTDSLVSTRGRYLRVTIETFPLAGIGVCEIQNDPAPQFNPRKEEDERATGLRRERQYAQEARLAQWFFGHISSSAAACRILKGRREGEYMVRRSGTIANALAISVVFCGKIHHYRVLYHRDSTGNDPMFVLVLNERHFFSSFEQLIDVCSRTTFLRKSQTKDYRLTTPILISYYH
ncbi:hypothetical protein PROFUN_06388 [Planoprotostelium fungivorum]|uniref:SH2 domain-containing protein n=1 Tax=Planoprotostelium fungivorum TaxID=1890364 RepID=A0A2P6NNR1_9EUKA|nr:hypothetical protein PROFUN_06388 [Planoprotostelium fungivorum]